jgi:uncharacterized membrane protein
MSNQVNAVARQRRIVLCGGLLTWCVAMVAIRVARTQSGYFLFLIWNLFLASIPLMTSQLLRTAYIKGASNLTQLALVAVWLLFLPNAPYLFTDIVHLQASTMLLYWYDAMLLLSAAGTGLLLGYVSLFDVHAIAAERFGVKMGWAIVIAALGLSGYGVYLGRVQRWNSWDVVANPIGLFGSIAESVLHPLHHLQVFALSGLIGVALVMGYLSLRAAGAAMIVRE